MALEEFNKNDLEETNCLLCGDNSIEQVVPYEQYSYLRCLKCGLIYLNTRLKEKALTDYYASEEYYIKYSADSGYEMQEKALRATFRKFLKKLKKNGLTGGRLLEVGCGYGYLLDEAKKYFPYRVGTDFSEAAVESAKRFADEVYCGGIDAIPENLKDFDVVISFAVMEHVYNPKSFVDDLNKRAAKNAAIITATPNCGDFWFKLLGKRWPLFIPPEHVCLYDRKTLPSLFKGKGYKDVQTFTSAHAWPFSVFLNKVGLGKIGDRISKLKIGKIPVLVPQIIISVSARKNQCL